MIAPNGLEITGTLETLSGVAEIANVSKLPDGSLDIQYGGNTEIWWDEQRTVVREGQKVFVDEEGNEWLESELDFSEPTALEVQALIASGGV